MPPTRHDDFMAWHREQMDKEVAFRHKLLAEEEAFREEMLGKARDHAERCYRIGIVTGVVAAGAFTLGFFVLSRAF